MTFQEDLVREIQTAKTYPGAIDDQLPALRVLYQEKNWKEMVKLLNTRKHHTGREYRTYITGDGAMHLEWSKV